MTRIAKRINLAVLLACFLLPSAAHSDNENSAAGFVDLISRNVSLSALVNLQWAFGVAEGKNQQLELTLEPEIDVDLPLGMKLTSIGRIRADAFDELGFGDSDQPTVSPETRRILIDEVASIELRELYIDANIGDILLRLGKQQIVWGKADGLKVLDVVNPQDFREFILEEFNDSRIPLWSLNAEIPIKGLVVQLIWITDNTYNILPSQRSTFEFTSPAFVPKPPPGAGVDLEEPRRPEGFFDSSEAGVRLSTFWRGWDLTLNYLYTYDDNPVLFQRLSLTPAGPVVTVEPRYRRIHIAGGTFSNAFGDLTIRGEIGFTFNKFFLASEASEGDGVTKGEELGYVLGFDWYRFRDTVLSLQFFQNVIISTDTDPTRDEADNSVTLLLRREFMNETLEIELLWLQSVNQGDGLARPKLSYDYQENVELIVAADIFYGDQDGLFGQFHEADRIVVGIEVGF